MSAATESPPDFLAFQSILEHLYWVLGKPLPEVMKIMEDDYGFVASAQKYKEYLVDRWEKRKYARGDESSAMLEIRRRRRVEENKETEFIRLGRVVNHKNLDLFAKRHNWEMGSSIPLPEIRVATPPSIRYKTPDLDTTGAFPPASPPYHGPTTGEEQAPLEESLEQYRAHALQIGDMPPSWQYDGDAFAAIQSSNHGSVPIQPTASPFLRHPIPHAPRGFLPNGTGPMLPSHTSNILMGEVSCWGYSPQLPPLPAQTPALGIHPSAPTFPSNYTPHIGQGRMATTLFYDGSQSLGAISGPGLALTPPRNIALQNTTVGSVAHLSGGMFHDGVGPSTAMPFLQTGDAMLRAGDDQLGDLDAMIAWPNKRARHM